MATDITPSSAPQCPDHIVFEHVTKEFRTRSGTVRALDDVSLAIKRVPFQPLSGTPELANPPWFASSTD